MVANFNTDRTTELIQALATLPQDWQLTPVSGNKRPYKDDWQKQGLDRAEIEKELKSGRAKGYGLLTGRFSGGLLAIDADGPAAHELLASYGELPPTVAFTSGKVGRCQYLLQVDESFWNIIKTVKLNTNVKGENGKNQLLEFRWNGCQSVLPPSLHPETGRYQWVNSPDSVVVAECPNWVIEVIMNAEDALKSEPSLPLNYKPQSNPLDDIPLPVPASIPLEWLLGESKERLNGVCEGSRNDSAFELACDAIGCTNELQRIGQSFDGDAYQLLQDFAFGCSPPIPSKEIDSIWKSAQKKNPSPSINQKSPDAFGNRLKSWFYQNHVKSSRTVSNSKIVTHPRFTPPDPAELTEQFATIYNSGLTGHKLTKALRPLGLSPQQTRRDYEEYVGEAERTDQRLERKADIESLLRIDKNRLNLEEYLPSDLANPIKQVAYWMGVDAETFLTYLLPIAASLINPNSYIMAKKCTNYKQPFVLYSGVVALTGDRKTPPLDAVKAALLQLQIEEDAKHEQALQRYEAEMQTLQNTKPKERNNEELPQKPKPPREFFVDNATVEALDKIKGQQPEHGLVSIKDELSGLFASHGAYKGGKGADKESFLSGWNGGGVKKNRAGDGSRVSLPRDSLSITGGIQPDKICSLLGDFNDSQGEWARFLWYHMPTREYKIPRDDTSYSLDGLLLDTYRKIDALPILKVHFDKQGQTHFDDWYDAKDEQKRAEVKPGLRAAIAKMPGQAIRLIGVLHVLNNVSGGEVPTEISLATVQAGCRLADFYLGQVTLLQSKGDTLNGELTPVLKEICNKVYDGHASLTARDVLASMRGVRGKSASQVRELFLELAAMGLVDTQGKGARLALIPKSADNNQNNQNPYSTKNVENIPSKLLTTADKVLTSSKQVETQAAQSVQNFNYQTADSADVFDTTQPKMNCLKVELDNGADISTADKNGSFKESVSTSAVDTESPTQQGDNAADSPSADCQQPSAVCSEPERPPVCSSSAEPIVLSDNPQKSEPAGTAPESEPATPGIIESIREAIATIDRAAAREAWQKIKNSPTQKEAVKAKLNEEEALNFKILVATGWLKGTQVQYTGTKFENLAGIELTVDSIDRNGITCKKPDGSYTTDLDKEDLMQVMPEGGE